MSTLLSNEYNISKFLWGMSICITLLNKGLSVKKLALMFSYQNICVWCSGNTQLSALLFQNQTGFCRAHQAGHFSESQELFVTGFVSHVYQTLLIPIALIIILRDYLLISKVSFWHLLTQVKLLVPLHVTQAKLIQDYFSLHLNMTSHRDCRWETEHNMSKNIGCVFKHEKHYQCFMCCILEERLISVCAVRH